jgi:hypothetical protein
MVVTLALILTFSPGEKEQRSHLSGFADNRPANPVAGFRVRRRVILPLPGGEGRFPSPAGAGEGGRRPGEGRGVKTNPAVRASVQHFSTPPVSPKSDSSRWNQTCPAEIR